ncbi:MAG: phosphonate C-P lyase system protein PhnH [Proteobacteria bacterium]|nr:phosphonate C-P lyase system protein PhnH [Pseudomonadota bacterium]MBU1641094.1 phosphonate C-P lyase system protein PhnH [Pseudomonadota bacterium]
MEIDAIWQSANQQRIFRALMDAMARPGSLQDVRPWLGGAAAWRGVLASLLDNRTSFADCHDLLDRYDWPLFQARREQAAAADYLLCQGSRAATMKAKVGTLTSPDQAATIIIQVDNLGQGPDALCLSGPGIKSSRVLPVRGLASSWPSWREEHLCFPLGIDLILVDQHVLAAIPRTTKLEVAA